MDRPFKASDIAVNKLGCPCGIEHVQRKIPELASEMFLNGN